MNETVSLLLSVCAVLVVIGGLVIVGGFLALRFVARRTRGLPVGAFGALGSALGGNDEGDTNTPVPARGRRTNLRDLAASVDFDAALARQDDSDPPSDISAQQTSPEQRDLQRGDAGPNRVLRSGHRAPDNRRPANQGPDQDFQRLSGETPSPDFDPPSDRSLRRRRKRDRNDSEDELFGGMLDEDGDGDVDF